MFLISAVPETEKGDEAGNVLKILILKKLRKGHVIEIVTVIVIVSEGEVIRVIETGKEIDVIVTGKEIV